MLKENVMMATPKNDDVVVNMVLAINTCSIVVMFQHQALSQNLASLWNPPEFAAHYVFI